jgi:hypothetical protein
MHFLSDFWLFPKFYTRKAIYTKQMLATAESVKRPISSHCSENDVISPVTKGMLVSLAILVTKLQGGLNRLCSDC